MSQVNLKKKIILSILISLISLFLIFLTTKLSQKKQENRSQATDEEKQPTFVLDSPYSSSQTSSFKGMIHCHSNISDADNNIDPTHVFQFYKNLNYDFISLTDHINYPENNTSKIKSLQENNNTGIDILTLPGGERFIDEDNDNTGHINTISNDVLVKELNTDSTGISIDELKVNNPNKIYIINHPSRQTEYWTDDRLNTISDYNGIEVWNNGEHEYFWDKILSSGKKVWGFSSDDCHNYSNETDCGSSFIRVFSQSLNRNDIFNNIKKGNFYSGNIPKGQPEISLKVTTDTNNITANTNIGTTILFIADNEVVKLSNNDSVLSYSPSGDEKYIRIKVVKSDSKIWSNPIFIKKIGNFIPTTTPTSNVTKSNSPTISFKFAFNSINSEDQKCFNQLKINLEIINLVKNKLQTFSNIDIKPINDEVNSNGNQIFLVENLELDSSIFSTGDKSILIKIKGSSHLKQKFCIDKQNKKIEDDNTCNINPYENKTYDFSEYSLQAGDIDQNGIINGSDLSLIRKNIGDKNCDIIHDLNLDGTINSFDINLIKKTMLQKDED
ncbi:hypothetical protein SDC9_65912 [bioreactor metagenome]|uniref:Dockerin domain-containing protein n=1 Tax=bioreactor metagenome TaxID=1076179 RepID=A0A644XTE3_9ZZZZ